MNCTNMELGDIFRYLGESVRRAILMEDSNDLDQSTTGGVSAVDGLAHCTVTR